MNKEHNIIGYDPVKKVLTNFVNVQITLHQDGRSLVRIDERVFIGTCNTCTQLL